MNWLIFLKVLHLLECNFLYRFLIHNNECLFFSIQYRHCTIKSGHFFFFKPVKELKAINAELLSPLSNYVALA